jgi:hypothetical protein
MGFQSILLLKGLVTHITDIRTLSSVYAVVSFQATLKTETFATRRTVKWIVIIVPEHMFLERHQIQE